jgi:hypothetical protein
MASRIPQFSAIPSIPQSGLTDWQFRTLSVMKENIELLTGTRGISGAAAITRGNITVSFAPVQTMQQVTAAGEGYTISGVNVASAEDYAKLIVNVQQLANDVANVRATLNALVNQLRG